MDAYDQEKADYGVTQKILGRLEGEAERTAGFFRGHTELASWVDYGGASHAECRKCGAEMTVILNPKPNETQISGEAIAVNCPKG